MSFIEQFDFFHEQAIAATGGLDDFGDNEYQQPMRLLLSDCDKHGNLCDIGKQLFNSEIIGMLVGRLRAEHGFKTYPQYLETPIEKPLIIVGMARTGSTVLHRLLSEDPENQALPLWLASMPMPRPPRESWEGIAAYQQVEQGFEQLYKVSPTIKQLHPMIPSENDECRFAYGQSFWNPGMTSMYHTPEYGEWCLTADVSYAYRYFKKVLGLIGAGSQKRWVLKDPCHMWDLPAVLKAFPDACVVMTYRDPLKSLTSLTSLVYQLRKMVEPGITPKALAKEHLHYWGVAMAKVDEARSLLKPEQLFELHFDDTKANPLGTMECIYDHFNFPLAEQTKQAWKERVEGNPNEGHGAHHYTPEEFGLTQQAVVEVIGDYYDHYLQIEKNKRFCA